VELMTEQMQPAPTFGQRVGRFFQGLIRLVLFGLIVAIVVTIVVAAINYASPFIYNNIVSPLQDNQAKIDSLQQKQSNMQEDFTGQLTEQRERIAQLESELATEREARSVLESTLNQQAETIAAQATAQAEFTADFAAEDQAAARAELEKRLEAQGQTLATLGQSVDALDAFVSDLDKTVTGVEQAVATPEAEVVNLQQQALLLQASQATLKARLHLIENNPGQAQQSLERADSALGRLEPLIPPEKEEDLAEIQTQLQATMTAIEEQPFIATQELEILWELLQRFSEVDEETSAS
jgi:chromosome segregation ATPase